LVICAGCFLGSDGERKKSAREQAEAAADEATSPFAWCASTR